MNQIKFLMVKRNPGTRRGGSLASQLVGICFSCLENSDVIKNWTDLPHEAVQVG